MNSALKLITILMIAIEISFTYNLILNSLIIIISILILIINKIKIKSLIYLVIVPIIPALGIYFAQNINGNPDYSIILVSRVYSYILLGSVFTNSSSIEELVFTLEQNFKLPAKFAYGILGAFNLTKTIQKEIKQIKIAAAMRNVYLSLLSPTLYFKSIMSALNWSNMLAEGMNSHVFIDNHPRTHFNKIEINYLDYLKMLIILIIIQIIIIF
ncbi:energy-coupling factor transporter transmembrane protein EcfT [Apilactobacillus apisilvae]|uniref:Energy-coupling factor transporter transmembrane protein EcfT n=1 Tax=Apilactobacillus apisilvae TaxID=2923364 RepID=A0ABY4PFX6_9LACO|nr:energy-coupling factor transporter transmembrane component T [Apilactobacillus apisilvae]UQS84414.1 energy-coupling factor transporter transmembrane protein EcfT [Apilactobacillus apisilvae]